MILHKLKINLFGESLKIKKIVASKEQILSWEKIALKMKQPLIAVITDPFFYHYLNDDNIRSIDDLKGETWEGLINTSKNQIEIWYKNKKVQKLKIDNLKPELLLFPIYNVKQNKITNNEKAIYIIEKAIGKIGTFEIKIDDFLLDNLEFELLDINGVTILQSFNYKHQIINFKNNDILITHQNSYIII